MELMVFVALHLDHANLVLSQALMMYFAVFLMELKVFVVQHSDHANSVHVLALMVFVVQH